MKQLNEYTHNLAGKEITYDNGNWSRQGKWHEDIYKVNEDGSVRHVRMQRYWTNVVGEEAGLNPPKVNRLSPNVMANQSTSTAHVASCQ